MKNWLFLKQQVKICLLLLRSINLALISNIRKNQPADLQTVTQFFLRVLL